jgi:hypothetical protein
MSWNVHSVDWAEAIERNRDALSGIVAALFAMLGLTVGGSLPRMPRRVHRAVFRLLTPAEAARRRLIVIAARGLVVKPAPARPMPRGRIIGQGGSPRPSFQLFDPRKRLTPLQLWRTGQVAIPRIHFFESDPRVVALWPAPAPKPEPVLEPDGRVNAESLCRRLHALKLGLEDVPRQAKRLARWRARREKMPAPKLTSPLRPGPPPGHRKRPVHEVDAILTECHGLALDALEARHVVRRDSRGLNLTALSHDRRRADVRARTDCFVATNQFQCHFPMR